MLDEMTYLEPVQKSQGYELQVDFYFQGISTVFSKRGLCHLKCILVPDTGELAWNISFYI